ncbi:hypothetical protein L202_01929 [Cryptococcus amylolentus CBS 6039]|uniref:Uncharacterized protein n=1 Tax=Cryptococcus amylolentus CBS 6039 TaxID=1295533 RepID=A0A1E3HZ05_9TREE|nr:hypothetical protein L202_01929 [Cryptococcus amylolentus CBS 6039]ODN81507.1 hypothetical protein L202_01929 [Cryptococcus amylolentus CBS 6039]
MDADIDGTTSAPLRTHSPPSTTPTVSPSKTNTATSEPSSREIALQTQINSLQSELDDALFSNISLRHSLSEAQSAIKKLESNVAKYEVEKGEKERAERRGRALKMQVDRLEWKMEELKNEMKAKEAECRALEEGKEWETKYRALKRGIDALSGGSDSPSKSKHNTQMPKKKPRVSLGLDHSNPLNPPHKPKPTRPFYHRHSVPSARVLAQYDDIPEVSDGESSGGQDDDVKDDNFVYHGDDVEVDSKKTKRVPCAWITSQKENTVRLLASFNSAHRQALALRSLRSPISEFAQLSWKKERLAELMVRFVNLPGSAVDESELGKPGGQKMDLIKRMRVALDQGLVYFEAVPPAESVETRAVGQMGAVDVQETAMEKDESEEKEKETEEKDIDDRKDVGEGSDTAKEKHEG